MGEGIPRSDRLKSPPVVGRWYMVPAILWKNGVNIPYAASEAEATRLIRAAPGAMWFPVWGNKHEDTDHLSFPYQHYHIDPRFLTKRHWKQYDYIGWNTADRTPMHNVQMQPLHYVQLKSGPEKPQLRRMRCSLSHVSWEFGEKKPIINMNCTFSGTQCQKGKLGWICPHKRFALGSVQAIDGVITCPLHGLRIDAESGKCIGAQEG